MWKSRGLGEISKSRWEAVCGFHGDVISTTPVPPSRIGVDAAPCAWSPPVAGARRGVATDAVQGCPSAVNVPDRRAPCVIVTCPSRCSRTSTRSPAQLRRPGCAATWNSWPLRRTVLSRATIRSLLATEDRIEINRPERDEGTREVARRARERRIVLGHELLGEIVVGRLAGPDRGHPELVDQAVLQRPIQPFAPPPRLRRVGRDVLGQRAPDLRQARPCPPGPLAFGVWNAQWARSV